MAKILFDTEAGTLEIQNPDGTSTPIDVPEEEGEGTPAEEGSEEDLLEGPAATGDNPDYEAMMAEEENEGPDADFNESLAEQAKEDAMGTELHPGKAKTAGFGKAAGPLPPSGGLFPKKKKTFSL